MLTWKAKLHTYVNWQGRFSYKKVDILFRILFYRRNRYEILQIYLLEKESYRRKA